MNNSMSITLTVKDEKIVLSDAQTKAFNVLSNLKDSFLDANTKKSFLSKILPQFFKENQIYHQGIYLYGKVGRGKSMLMLNFFNEFPSQNKIYLHFNSFMQKIHQELYKARQDKETDKERLIEIVTKSIIKDNKLICLDEFQVDDVADALILRRIFSYIFKKGVVVVFTSNLKPENLYKDGLQRDLFLKFVDKTLKKHCQIINLDSDIDYRENFLHKVRKHYFYPANKENNKKILNIFSHLSHNKKPYQDKIKVLGRDLIIKKAYENIALFNFKELCQENLGVADYQEICKKYSIIFLTNVPKLSKEDRNEAKRLILFIDEVYENKNILLMSCAVKMAEIYKDGKDANKFKRTVSRLKEIMSDDYGAVLNQKV